MNDEQRHSTKSRLAALLLAAGGAAALFLVAATWSAARVPSHNVGLALAASVPLPIFALALWVSSKLSAGGGWLQKFEGGLTLGGIATGVCAVALAFFSSMTPAALRETAVGLFGALRRPDGAELPESNGRGASAHAASADLGDFPHSRYCGIGNTSLRSGGPGPFAELAASFAAFDDAARATDDGLVRYFVCAVGEGDKDAKLAAAQVAAARLRSTAVNATLKRRLDLVEDFGNHMKGDCRATDAYATTRIAGAHEMLFGAADGPAPSAEEWEAFRGALGATPICLESATFAGNSQVENCQALVGEQEGIGTIVQGLHRLYRDINAPRGIADILAPVTDGKMSSSGGLSRLDDLTLTSARDQGGWQERHIRTRLPRLRALGVADFAASPESLTITGKGPLAGASWTVSADRMNRTGMPACLLAHEQP